MQAHPANRNKPSLSQHTQAGGKQKLNCANTEGE